MNKTEFLDELRKNVRMLEDSEQEDIISEYSQHIDMKVEGGMSEAEAIADFGPIDELIAETLAAYHVKVPEKDPVSESASFAAGGKQMADAAMGATKKGYSKVKGVFVGAVDATKRKADAAAQARNERKEVKLANGESGSVSSAQTSGVNADGERGFAGQAGQTSAIGQVGRVAGGAASAVARGGSNLWGACIGFCKTCLRWFWNACVACFALCCLVGAVGAVFAFGMSVVLLIQGYPLIGATIGLAGGTVSLVCLTLLALRLIWRKVEVVAGQRPDEVVASGPSAPGIIVPAGATPASGLIAPAGTTNPLPSFGNANEVM